MNLAKLAPIQDYDKRKKIMMLLHKFERELDQERVVDRYIRYVESQKWEGKPHGNG